MRQPESPGVSHPRGERPAWSRCHGSKLTAAGLPPGAPVRRRQHRSCGPSRWTGLSEMQGVSPSRTGPSERRTVTGRWRPSMSPQRTEITSLRKPPEGYFWTPEARERRRANLDVYNSRAKGGALPWQDSPTGPRPDAEPTKYLPTLTPGVD